jgi:DNA replication protein DnaC
MTDTPQVLLAHHLKALKLPTFLREYDKVARQCAAEGTDYPRYLLRLAEQELIDRERRMVERRIKAAKFPTVKSLDSFDFAALPSLNKALVMELARSEYVERRENIIAVGNSGTGKSHIGLGLGLAACQKGLSVGFTTAAALVHELIEARDEKRLLRLQRQFAAYKLLIIDELGYVPLSQTGAELLFEVFSQRYERGSTRHLEPAIRRMDQRVQLRAAHRCVARPAHPPRPYPRDEWRQLQAQSEQAPITARQLGHARGQSDPSLMPDEKGPQFGGLLSAFLMHFCSGVDTYPASASTQPKRVPEAMTRSISSIAISGFVRAVWLSFGTWARAMRSGSSVQLAGRNNRRPTMTGTSRDANVSETSDWQLAVFPRAEAYCGATPTERHPFLGNAVSSMTRNPALSPTSASAFCSRAASSGALSHTPAATK